MSTSLLALPTIELVSVRRSVPFTGAPSTQDYNADQAEKVSDLIAITEFINNTLLPILNALTTQASGGLTGTGVLTDPTDPGPLFYDSANAKINTVADTIRLLNTLVTASQTELDDVKIQLGQVQARLSSTNQNDVALALQSLTTSLNALSGTQTAQSQQISQLQVFSGARQVALASTGSIVSGATAVVAVVWPVAFADDNYSVSVAIEDATGDLEIVGFTRNLVGQSINVRVHNNGGVARVGTVNAFAQHV